jgi:predicted secreted protein
MTAKGVRDVTLKVDRNGQGGFVTIATLRNASISMNTILAEVAGDGIVEEARELLNPMAAVRIAGECLFTDAASRTIMEAYFSQTVIMEWRAIIPYLGVLQGLFQITAFGSGDRPAPASAAEIALLLAGNPTFMSAETEMADV